MVSDLVAPSTGPLAPGGYTRSAFRPRITFEVGEGSDWTAVQLGDGFFDVQRDVDSPDVIAVQFANVECVFGGGAEPATLESSAVAAPALLGNAGVRILETSPATIAGLTGHGLTLDHAGPSQDFTPVLRVPAGPISIGPGRRLWVGLFDVEGAVLGVLIGGSVARWTEAVTAAQELLASVSVGSRPEVIAFDDLEHTADAHDLVGADHDVPFSVILIHTSPGGGPAVHAHPYPEVFIVEAGEATFRLGDEMRVVGAGHVVVGPSMAPHGFTNTGAGELRIVSIHGSPEFVTQWLDGPDERWTSKGRGRDG